MQSITAKFTLIFILTGIVLTSLSVYSSYNTSHRHIEQMIEQQASLLTTVDEAVREYITNEVRPVVRELAGPDKFIPSCMSSVYASRRVFDSIQKEFPDYILKHATTNPRNVVNTASPEEEALLEQFKQNPDLHDTHGLVTLEGKEYYAHLTPRVAKAGCANCHSNPAFAPAELIERYGSEAGFYQAYEGVVALNTIAIPTDKIEADIARGAVQQSLFLGSTSLILIGVIALVFRNVFSHRISIMAARFEEMANSPDLTNFEPVAAKGTDEVSRLATSFNALASRVADSQRTLEQHVTERTTELQETIVEQRSIAMQLEAAMSQLEAANQQAQAATIAKSEFLANMSHEIRTPMTAILGFTDLLQEDALHCANEVDSPNCRYRKTSSDAVETIRRNAEYLLKVINDILDLSKIEARKVQIKETRCSLFELLTDVQSTIQVSVDAKALSFDVEYMTPIPETIETDPMRLRQILINLLGNAVKFTDKGSIRLNVSLVEESNAHPHIHLEIIDTGIGMNAADAKAVFDPFVQADTSATREFGGTGLGLAICKRLADVLGGSLKIVSTKLDVGTHFLLAIPAGDIKDVPRIEHVANEHPEKQAENKPTPIARLDGFSILLAEDGPDNQRLISHVLKKAGAQVTVVENGLFAVQAVVQAEHKNDPYDLILMDIQMPFMDGHEATQSLRNQGTETPIIALTAHAMSGDREKCIDAGCTDYATKPINRRVLIETIRKNLPQVAETTNAE